jgi:nicotinamide-nucleotide amidase
VTGLADPDGVTGVDQRAGDDAIVADDGGQDSADQLAAAAIALLIAEGRTVAVAESLTGGMLAAQITSIPGASDAFRGGVVAYATDLKASLLGVPAGLLDRHGAVHPDVAVAMAQGARRRLGADLGVATTGVAGPDRADDQPVGTVYIAVSTPSRTAGRALALTGDRGEIRAASVRHALALLVGMLREEK